MNFTDAVRELAEGRCEKIEKDGIFANLYMGYLQFKCSSGGELNPHYFFRPEFYLADDWELVGEKPQMEEVPVVRWLHRVEDRLMPEGFTPKDKQGFVKLAGIDQRPIPRKVKRREEITPLSITHNEVVCCKISGAKGMDSSMKFYREWEEEAPK